MGLAIVDRRAVDADLAGVGRVVAHDALDQGRLAGAVLAQQRVDAAGGDVERDVLERGERAEALGQAGGGQAQRLGHG